MPSLKPKARSYAKPARSAGTPFFSAAQRRVLRLGLLSLALLLLGAGLWRQGWLPRQLGYGVQALYSLTVRLGFGLQDVTIVGREAIDRDALLATLQVERGMPILALDRQDMVARLRTLPWLEAATVERHLPGTLRINLTERQPLARWQHQNQIKLLDVHGATINGVAAKDFMELPLLVGAGAPEEAADFLAAIEEFPAIRKAFRAAIRVGERRWDMQLEPGVTIRLPQGQELLGLKRLATLMNDPQILQRDITAVDLRYPDRLILERPLETRPAGKAAAGQTGR
jgi:cell division protein FtsQ